MSQKKILLSALALRMRRVASSIFFLTHLPYFIVSCENRRRRAAAVAFFLVSFEALERLRQVLPVRIVVDALEAVAWLAAVSSS